MCMTAKIEGLLFRSNHFLRCGYWSHVYAANNIFEVVELKMLNCGCFS